MTEFRSRSRVLVPEVTLSTSTVKTTYFDDSYPGDEDVVVSNHTHSGPSHSSSESTQDVVTPNWTRRRNNGEIINNPFVRTRTTVRPPQATAYAREATSYSSGAERGWNGYVQFGALPMNTIYQLDLLTNDTSISEEVSAAKQSVIDIAVQKAYANIDASEMLALATAAESKKTVESLLSCARRILKIARAARKLDIKRLKREIYPQELQDRYMELRYALRPIVYDMVGVMKVVDTISTPSDRHTARGFKQVTLEHSDVIANHIFGGTIADTTRTRVHEITARAGVLSQVKMSYSAALGLTQLPETAWELFPLSFVIDWVLNIGQAIAALTTNAGLTQLASWVTVIEKITYTNKMGNTRPLTTAYTRTNKLVHTAEYGVTVERQERIVDPSLYVWPTFEVNLNAYKINDLVNIIGQITK